MAPGTRVASYDIGSNSVILLVAERDIDGAWHPVEDLVEVARISEGLDATGRLAEVPIRRAEEVLGRYAARAGELGANHAVATGTAPFRRSENGAEVAQRLGQVIGTHVDIVSGDREAQLSLLATRRSFPDLEDMLVVDIGGASTELIRVRPGMSAAMKSLDVGSVRLTERCVSGAPMSISDRDTLVAEIGKALQGDAVDDLVGDGRVSVVGIAGTVTTIVSLAEGMTEYDAGVVHGYTLALNDIDRVFGMLAPKTVAEREAVPGMPAGRADVLPAGAALLAAILRRAGTDHVRVSDRGTRWGRLFAEFG